MIDACGFNQLHDISDQELVDIAIDYITRYNTHIMPLNSAVRFEPLTKLNTGNAYQAIQVNNANRNESKLIFKRED